MRILKMATTKDKIDIHCIKPYIMENFHDK